MLTRVSAVLAVLTVLAVAASMHAATVIVNLPGDAPLRLVDDPQPPTGGPRISCPPTCTYSSDGPSIGIINLRVTQDPDPRTNDPPYDILTADGCVGGEGSLPNVQFSCRLPDEGNATISFTTRYRPVIAVTSGGTIGGMSPNLFVVGGPGPDYMGGDASSFSCDFLVGENLTPEEQAARVRSCARHLSVDQPVFVQAPDVPPASALVSASAPCALGPVEGNAQRCDFTLTEDTCISVLYLNETPPGFPERTISGPDCPSGPGVEGTGGGGGSVPPEIDPVKALALEAMRAEFERVVYPCLVGSSGVSVYVGLVALGPAISIMIGGSLVAAATPACATGIRRLMQLQLIVNDPPDPNFQEVAKVPKKTKAQLDLPSCDEFSGKEKRFCRKLGKSLTKYVEKDDRVSDIAETLRITVERAVGAFQSDDEKALKKQLKAVSKRQRQLDGAKKKRARQGAKLAKVFDKEQILVELDADQFTTGSEAALEGLAEEGLPEDEARTLLDTTLDPRTLDWLSVIAR